MFLITSLETCSITFPLKYLRTVPLLFQMCIRDSRYRTIYRHLCEFVPKVYRRDDIPLKELNLTFINNFEYSCVRRRNAAPIPYGVT